MKKNTHTLALFLEFLDIFQFCKTLILTGCVPRHLPDRRSFFFFFFHFPVFCASVDYIEQCLPGSVWCKAWLGVWAFSCLLGCGEKLSVYIHSYLRILQLLWIELMKKYNPQMKYENRLNINYFAVNTRFPPKHFRIISCIAIIEQNDLRKTFSAGLGMMRDLLQFHIPSSHSTRLQDTVAMIKIWLATY